MKSIDIDNYKMIHSKWSEYVEAYKTYGEASITILEEKLENIKVIKEDLDEYLVKYDDIVAEIERKKRIQEEQKNELDSEREKKEKKLKDKLEEEDLSEKERGLFSEKILGEMHLCKKRIINDIEFIEKKLEDCVRNEIEKDTEIRLAITNQSKRGE